LISLLRLVACAAALMLHARLEGFLVAWAAGQVGGFVYLVVMTLRQLSTRRLLGGFSWRGPLSEGMPGVWRFAWNTNLSASLDVALTHATTLVVGALLGPASAAFWRIGRQVADGIAKPARLLAFALYPELSRLRESGDDRLLWRLAAAIGALAGGVVLTLLVVGVVAGPLLLKLVMGASFAPAAAAMNWQIAALVIGAFALPLEPMLMTRGHPGAVVRVQLLVSLGYLALLPFLVHSHGLTGAGAGLVMAEAALAAGWTLAIWTHRLRPPL
jgi:O-antigen/teichoic acid export membrane protein